MDDWRYFEPEVTFKIPDTQINIKTGEIRQKIILSDCASSSPHEIWVYSGGPTYGSDASSTGYN